MQPSPHKTTTIAGLSRDDDDAAITTPPIIIKASSRSLRVLKGAPLSRDGAGARNPWRTCPKDKPCRRRRAVDYSAQQAQATSD